MHYNKFFEQTFRQLNWEAQVQPSCLASPYRGTHWDIIYPAVLWKSNRLVVLHAQDFLTTENEHCPELQAIEQHFGQYADQVVVVHWNIGLERIYNGPVKLIHFPTHTWEILERLTSDERYANWQSRVNLPKTQNWQCLNGIPRPHRRCVHSWLKDKPNGILSLADIDPLPRDSAYYEVYNWSIDGSHINELNYQRLSWVYGACKINIVTETQYTGGPGIVSEKTLFALLSRQIPLIIGYRGIVADCRALGMDMFDDLVDTSYDDLPDGERWLAALELNQDLIVNTPDLSQYQGRLIKQQQWALKDWPAQMVDNFKTRANEIHNSLTRI